MTVPFYMDQHVQSAITNGLRRRSVDVLTAQEDGSSRLDDELLLERATSLDRTVFSMDDDFLAITHRWLQTGREFAGLVYSQQMHISIGQAIHDLEIIAKALTPQEMHNRIEFIPYS